MKVKRLLRPGESGTKRLVMEFGARLLHVRYRYDKERDFSIKTVELIVSEKPYRHRVATLEKIVGVQVALQEVQLQSAIKQVGGRWNHREKYWEMPFAIAREMGLIHRIIA